MKWPMTREVKKPRESLTTIGVFLICCTRSKARASASSPVLLALDDLHQRHLVDGREEVQPDEVGRPLDAFGERGDGQRGGVGAQQRVGLDDVLDLLEDLVLERRVLEDRLDDGVAARDGLRVGGGRDAGEQLVALGLGRTAALERLLQQTRGVGLALLRPPPGYTSLRTTSMPALAQE